MNRSLWIAAGTVVLGGALIFAVSAVEQAAKTAVELPALLPEGALLSIEARDFGSLLHDWNTSDEKRAWLSSDNHAAFSNSRLFTRLSQAQDEFSTAASLPTNASLLEKVAGKESCLAVYDIGNLEFVYVTRLTQQDIENTPLWQIRDKFEQRKEAGTVFYVHKDPQSSRTAAFAAKDGWLILATREDLVAGVLDRLASGSSHSLSGEAWYAEAVKQAGSDSGDLRMALNFEKIVPSPYFRSYWVQRNITEMKQYASAVSDLYRSSDKYREQRVLVRRAPASSTPQSDVRQLTALAPGDAAFYEAQASPSTETVLNSLKENLLELRPQQSRSEDKIAPAQASAENAGSAAQLDVFIDQAPVVEHAADPYQPLRALLDAQQPDAILQVYSTRAPRAGVFVSLQSATILSSSKDWDESAVRASFTAAMQPGLTAGGLGAGWEKRSNASGDYLAFNGAVSLYAKISGKQLLLANDAALLEELMARPQAPNPTGTEGNVTYAARFRPRQEQTNFRLLTAQLDLVGQRGAADNQRTIGGGQSPAFFSGNVNSLGRTFSKLDSEQIEEKDQGARVVETVTYQWAH